MDRPRASFNLGASVDDGLWHHLVWAWDGSEEKIYLDDIVRTDTSTFNGTITLAEGGAILGQEQDSLGSGFDINQIFHGWIDEVKIFSNRVLSQTEIDEIKAYTRFCSDTCYTDAIAEYHMDESSWTTGQPEVLDSSGNGYHGIPVGNAAINTADSHLCHAGEFSGNNSSVNINGLPVSTTSGHKTTVTFWMKWGGANSEMPIGWHVYDLWLSSNRFGFNTGCSDVFGFTGTGSLVNNWRHVAAVFTNNDPESNILYIDGELKSMTLLSGSFCSRTVTSNFSISGWRANTGYKFDGLIDELNIYDRGLSASEIKEDMDADHICP